MAEKTAGKRKKKRSFKKTVRNILIMVLAVAAGGAAGYGFAAYADLNIEGGLTFHGFLLWILYLIIAFYAAFFLQTVFHEGGHMIFGLLTGYRFSSFRIGSFMWIMQDGKLRFRRLSLSGTGGQCIMEPPDMKDGTLPYVLYNAGGVILNLLTGAAALAGCLMADGLWYLSLFFGTVAMAGAWLALVNGIPLKLEMVYNDGRNIVEIGKSRDAAYGFWLQLKMAKLQAEGVRVKDMPDEWFFMPEPERMQNSMTVSVGVSAAGKMMDEHDFSAAAEAIDVLLGLESGVTGLMRAMLTGDRVYCELLGDQKKEILGLWKEPWQQKVMKQMKNYLSVIRTAYAYALLCEEDLSRADKLKQEFDRRAKSWPYPADARSERELMELAGQRADGAEKTVSDGAKGNL